MSERIGYGATAREPDRVALIRAAKPKMHWIELAYRAKAQNYEETAMRQLLLRSLAMIFAAMPCAAKAQYASDLDCNIWTHNANGTWSPKKKVSVGRIGIEAGTPIGPNVKGVDGILIKETLDKNCLK